MISEKETKLFPLDQCPVTPPNITVEGAQFVYKPNFEGRQETYNDEGDRYFNLRIPDNIVESVTNDGWNIKWTKPSKAATPQQIAEHVSEPFLQVHVGFTYRPPTIILREDGKETFYNETNAALLDSLEFQNMDIVVRGRPWDNANGCGIKAWLQTFVADLETDDILRKYARLREEDPAF